MLCFSISDCFSAPTITPSKFDHSLDQKMALYYLYKNKELWMARCTGWHSGDESNPW
ncbi:hypothetical protein MHPYR_100080 [uncultured Mycobacterium sp.]|uniref:Uncharacterized protein n=1 Tax=uncultured Mycobacterium sp. TaxID=171292 RepID=A0A1Y5NXK3_9MYCO|nr:hypothetical protein MHPYR_100080 [uncultured Mycobacterium sp.]